MSTKIALLATALVAAGTAALADDRIPTTAFPPAAIIHQLVADGYDVRKLEFERGRYDVQVRSTDGKLLKLAADPTTGKAYSPSATANRSPRDAGAAVPTNAAEAITLAAMEGHYDVTELKFRDGIYRIEARDSAGAPARIDVDAQTAQIAQIQHY